VGLTLDLEDYHPSVLLHCWLGHLTCKIVSKMTYVVPSGTLNPTVPYHTAHVQSVCSTVIPHTPQQLCKNRNPKHSSI